MVRKSVFILMLLSLFSVDTQLFAEQQESNEQAGFFEMSLEDSKDRIKALEEENRMLKEKIAAIENTENLEALVEFRFNEYKVASQEHGLGIGLKYKF